jgi:hypothetical protein
MNYPLTINGRKFIKQTIPQVKNEIFRGGKWSGLMVGNKVNSFHFLNGWHLANEVELTTLEQLEKTRDAMMVYLEKELGNRIAFYKEVK